MILFQRITFLTMMVALPLTLHAEGSGIPADIASAEERSVSSGNVGGALQELISVALANNPELSAATFDKSAAEARTISAKGSRLPRFNVEGGYTIYSDDLRLVAASYNGEVGVFGNNVLAADLVLRLPLYAGGRLVAEQRAAELLEASAGKRLARSREDLVYNVSSLYYTLLAQEKLIASLSFSVKTMEGQLERANRLIAARKAARVDALRTEVKLADLRQRVMREQNSMNVLRQALMNLLGRTDGSSNLAISGELQAPTLDVRTIETLTKTALERRQDAIAARTELDAQEARVAAARAGHWPTVNLVGAVGWRQMVNPSQEPKGQDAGRDASRIGITVDIPLFEGGRTNARISEEQAKYSSQSRRLDKLLLQVRLEVQTALANLNSGLERLRSTDQATELAAESLRIEEEKYALGRGAVLDVLDAQTALLDAETTHIRALADANAAAAQLAWATGENLP